MPQYRNDGSNNKKLNIMGREVVIEPGETVTVERYIDYTDSDLTLISHGPVTFKKYATTVTTASWSKTGINIYKEILILADTTINVIFNDDTSVEYPMEAGEKLQFDNYNDGTKVEKITITCDDDPLPSSVARVHLY